MMNSFRLSCVLLAFNFVPCLTKIDKKMNEQTKYYRNKRSCETNLYDLFKLNYAILIYSEYLMMKKDHDEDEFFSFVLLSVTF